VIATDQLVVLLASELTQPNSAVGTGILEDAEESCTPFKSHKFKLAYL
jgi:hypothetical protein